MLTSFGSTTKAFKNGLNRIISMTIAYTKIYFGKVIRKTRQNIGMKSDHFFRPTLNALITK